LICVFLPILFFQLYKNDVAKSSEVVWHTVSFIVSFDYALVLLIWSYLIGIKKSHSIWMGFYVLWNSLNPVYLNGTYSTFFELIYCDFG
jgi:hypothetical protein